MSVIKKKVHVRAQNKMIEDNFPPSGGAAHAAQSVRRLPRVYNMYQQFFE
jgi:hypothetical protein